MPGCSILPKPNPMVWQRAGEGSSTQWKQFVGPGQALNHLASQILQGDFKKEILGNDTVQKFLDC